eukprot:scaffold42395_cov30-Tisochrysis_lutea.AAC.3
MPYKLVGLGSGSAVANGHCSAPASDCEGGERRGEIFGSLLVKKYSDSPMYRRMFQPTTQSPPTLLAPYRSRRLVLSSCAPMPLLM